MFWSTILSGPYLFENLNVQVQDCSALNRAGFGSQTVETDLCIWLRSKAVYLTELYKHIHVYTTPLSVPCVLNSTPIITEPEGKRSNQRTCVSTLL